jgi:plasmid stabilization system protein ParE
MCDPVFQRGSKAMASVRVLSTAERDIADALNWYLEKSAIAADRLEQEIDEAIAKIAREPERFPKIDSLHRYALLRRFPYYIAYRIDPCEVLIIAVRHAARSE